MEEFKIDRNKIKKVDEFKIKINRITGLATLIGGFIVTLPFLLMSAGVIPLNSYGNLGIIIGYTMPARIAMWLFNIFSIVLMLFLIFALIESIKANIKIHGHVIGIVGIFYFLITSALPRSTTLIMFIISGIFILLQKENSNKPQEVNAVEKNLHTLLNLHELE